MKKLNLWGTFAFVIALLTINVSCSNEMSDISEVELTNTVQDEAQLSSISDQVLTNADEYVNEVLLLSTLSKVGAADGTDANTKTGPVVTFDPAGNIFPKTITIDYGTNGIVGKRGNILKGKIIVVVSNRMNVSGSSRTYSYDNFSVNDNVVKGTKTVTYNGETAGNKNWTVVVKDTVIKAADGKVIISNSTRIRTRISDNDTPNRYYDDKYSIEGSATGINGNGVAYTMLITKPLIIDGVWPVFVEGTMVVSTEKRSVITDYGDGTRDMKATVTVNGVTKTISLRK
jgi:hypothetical protein